MVTGSQLRTRLVDARNRASVLLRVAQSSGSMWQLTPRGVVAIAKTLLTTQPNPTQVYRVHAAGSPDKVAVRCGDDGLTYRELDERIDSLAHGLAARGFGRGKSLVVMMHNSIEMLELQAAAARVGASAVSVSWRSTPSELTYLASHCQAHGIAFDSELWPVVEPSWRSLAGMLQAQLYPVGAEIPHTTPHRTLFAADRSPFRASRGTDEEAAVVIYTSGTTGKPKGAVRKFPKDAMAQALRFIAETPMHVNDVHLVACPMYHSTAFGFATLTQLLGGTLVILRDFSPEAFLSHVERYRVTSTALVPTMLHRIVELDRGTLDAYDTRSLRLVFSGGSALSGPLAHAFMDRFGDIVFNFYGATETGLVTLASPKDLRAAPGTIGKLVPGNEVRLLDEDGREVADGAIGELYVQNSLLVSGYHRDDGATKESLRDGYWSVGDLARRDREGRYFLEGRKRDMIISGGVNIYPAEIEAVLEGHPGVGEAAVVGIADAEWGERVRAFVAPKQGALLDAEELRGYCRERLSGPKVPRDFVLLEALPRNPTGKVLKRELRAKDSAARAASGAGSRGA